MTVMHDWDAARLIRLLKRWEWQCVICGHEFRDIACITVEHLIPKCKGGARHDPDNMAPAHYNCNHTKADRSLIRTAQVIEFFIRKQRGVQFLDWLNKKVPGRSVPPHLMAIQVKRGIPIHGEASNEVASLAAATSGG